MANLNLKSMRAVPSGRIERWLGAEKAEKMSRDMRGWYGPPINIRDLPGSVWIGGDGEFVGDFQRGFFDSAMDALDRKIRMLSRRLSFDPCMAGAGFASISAALARASAGYGQKLNGNILKTGATGVTSSANSMWQSGSMPVAGGAASAAPGGRAPDKSTTGAMSFNNPSGSDTLHLVGANLFGSIAGNTVLLYDRIFDVAKTMNSTTTEAVTGIPTRYQSTTGGAADSAEGNFLFIEVQTVLANTPHNWATCLYTDQGGATGQTLPTVFGNAAAIASRLDMSTFTWFCPLASGDSGIAALSQMQCSSLVATGAINFVIGHPIAFMAFPFIPHLLQFDWLTNMDQAPRIFNDACLALLEMPKPSTVAMTLSGQISVTSAPP